MIETNRGIEIAQAIADIQKICVERGLTCEWNYGVGITWLEIWADGVDDIEDLCANVDMSFGKDI